MCVRLMTQLSLLMGRLGSRTPVNLHQLHGWCSLPLQLTVISRYRNCCVMEVPFLCLEKKEEIKIICKFPTRVISNIHVVIMN